MIAKQDYQFIKGALWISYTGLKDFLRCPRAYYLKNRYRDPKSGYRLQIASPYMTLGFLVHDAIKWYLQTGRAATYQDIVKKFRNHWLKYRGKRGGFTSLEEEGSFGKRGLSMLDNFIKNVSSLETNLPAYDFLKYTLDDRIVLNGKLDFVGQLKDGSLHILDFKTGSKDEDDPTQLYIYAILAESNFQKEVSKISYWYLDRSSGSTEAVLDPLDEKLEWLRSMAKEIEEVVKVDSWVCAEGDSLYNECKKYEAIIDGKGEFQFSDDDFKKDVYFLDSEKII